MESLSNRTCNTNFDILPHLHKNLYCEYPVALFHDIFLYIHFQLEMNDFHLSQLMRLWYLSHRRPTKAQASLRIRAVSPEPSLFAQIKYGSRRRVRPKNRHARLKNEFTEDEKCHNLMRWLICQLFLHVLHAKWILSFQTDWLWQTVLTLKEQSNQGLHCLPFRPHLLDTLLYGKTTLFKF